MQTEEYAPHTIPTIKGRANSRIEVTPIIKSTATITKVVKDTVYIRDSITGYDLYLPIIQKHFSEKNRYDLWVSGVEPLNVDRIDVYNQVKYETITNTIN